MNQTVSIGENVNLTCGASGGKDPINYRWLFNGTELMADPGHISGVTTTTLMITNVTATDGGAYSCEATDAGAGNVTSDEATLFSKYLLISPCNVVSKTWSAIQNIPFHNDSLHASRCVEQPTKPVHCHTMNILTGGATT